MSPRPDQPVGSPVPPSAPGPAAARAPLHRDLFGARRLVRFYRVMLAVYWPTLTGLTHWPNLHVDVDGRGSSFGDLYLDTIIHASVFLLLTVLLIGARIAGRRQSMLVNVVTATLLAGGYAYVDELTQGLPGIGRTVSSLDLLCNLIGVTAVILAVALGRAWQGSLETRRYQRAAGQVTLAIWAPLCAYLLFWPSVGASWVIPVFGFMDRPWLYLPADKVLHLGAGGVLVWLMLWSRWLVNRRVIVLLAALVGVGVEAVQWTTGRGFETADISAHMLGVMLGAAMLRATELAGGTIRRAVMRKAGTEPSGFPAEVSAEQAHQAAADPANRRFIGHAVTVSFLTLLSRISGLVRDAVLAAAFGLSGVTDAFFVGFLIPNLFRRLFGEGALAAAFIPIYTNLVRNDPVLARRFASICVAMLLVGLGLLTVLGELVLWWLAGAHDWSQDGGLAIRLTMVMLPYMPLVCGVALLGGILQVHGRFGPAATAPILLNLVMIAAIFWATRGIDLRTLPAMREAVVAVAWAVLAAGLFQLVWQLVAVLRYEPFTTHWSGVAGSVKQLATTMVPMLLGLAVFQFNTAMDSLIAFWLSARHGKSPTLSLGGWEVAYPLAEGSVAALNWAQRLYQFPLGVFGIAIATAVFPALAHAAAQWNRSSSDPHADYTGSARFSQILHQGLRLTMFIGLPASVGMLAVRLPLVRLIFQRGSFDLEAASLVAHILAGYATAIWAYSMIHVTTRAYYALGDARTPVRVGMAMVAFNLMLNVILIWPLGAAGLAWSTAVSAGVQVVVLLWLLRKQIHRPVSGAVWLAWRKVATMSALMAALLWLVLIRFDLEALTQGQSALLLAGLVGGGAAVYLASAWWLQCEELGWLLRRGG